MRYIYIITNSIDDRFYIGQTNDVNNRFKRHLYCLSKNIHHSKYLQHFYNKYKSEGLEFSIYTYMEDLDEEYIDLVEEELIDKHYGDNLFNVSKNASGGDIISHLPDYEEYCLRQSKIVSERMKDPLERLKHSYPGKSNFNYRHGKFVKVDKICEDCGKKLPNRFSSSNSLCRSCFASRRLGSSNSFYGKKHTEETKRAIVEGQKKRREANKELGVLEVGSKPVFAEGKLFRSCADACKYFNLSSVAHITFRVRSKNWLYRSYYFHDSPKDYSTLKIYKTHWYIKTPECDRIIFNDYVLYKHPENLSEFSITLKSKLDSKKCFEYQWIGPPAHIEPEYQVCALLKNTIYEKV